MTPRYESYWLSKISAFRGAFGSPLGGGTFFTISSSTASMLVPILAEISGASMAGRPMMSSTSCLALAGSAAGRSILLNTGRISRSCSMARYVLARVWASTPWVASTTSTAPSQAARERDTS